MSWRLSRRPKDDRFSRRVGRVSDVGFSRGMDCHHVRRRASGVAVTRSEAAGGTASGRRSGARFAVEAVGNFLLVFAFGAAIATHNWFAPLLIGAPLVAMVYSASRASVGHYNPALTLAMLIRRRLTMRDALVYWFVQLGAGLLAAMTVRAVVDSTQLAITAERTVNGFSLVGAFALELVFTCGLCCMAVVVSTGSSQRIDDYFRWPIVAGMVAGVIAISAITKASLDPAVSFYGAVQGIFSWPTLWVYLVSQLLSGIAASLTFLSLANHD
jgi:aquaporin Z